MTEPSLRIRGLTKSFGGVRALDGVDLTVPMGQVHALLGHNGAGKSTLIKCLGGAFPPDAGTIEVGGRAYERLSPRESIAAGVAIIFQTLSVVDALTVAENIFLGQEWTRYGRIDRRAQDEVAAGLLERVAATCSPRDRVGELSMGQRQLVEIAKALSRSASVLVLDEPTAALSAAESDALAERVEDLRAQGLAIVYVTHLLAEVERLADAVTVLRDGRVAHHAVGAGRRRRELVAAIAGRPAAAPGGDRPTGTESPGPDTHTGTDTATDTTPRATNSPASPVARGVGFPDGGLVLEGLRGPGFGPVTLTVGSGERVGLYGLIGSGRTRILETLYGRRRASGGTVRVGDRTVRAVRPGDALAAGIALVPADRRRQGLFPALSARDNALLPAVRPLARYGVRALGAERRLFDAVAGAVGLRPVRPRLPAASFSGGNQQKLVLGRWINDSHDVRVLLLDEPTQGVDVGARQEIYQVVRSLGADRGTAVLFASSDPEEIVALADRCLVVAGGRVVGELSGAELTEEALLSAVHDASADPPVHSENSHNSGDSDAAPAPAHQRSAPAEGEV
ncbi:sugar ABC transporter ATP-binding protein [Streptomyces turgidiscabies]|uniref:ABC transporter, ATP-binding protein n=1 Tax=Streptomyces turgidiscabies (strain Car8) TaxID=698760 RepID=L7ERU7_STRT8|nr:MULTISPECIES: sugar ABC transporter ATP-binding protein [Streptomyces]ELP61456.1 ABC transporter, ATP-binding protein [Streptomyces turgidiscabies Car8]MDX3491941.1 sugar ABC transporter ATP-binding protein [Streptomyces turgidiscabies]GAQ71942.1 arabinose import ATP-binding protein AraG [Streptomyces turgidiscabies]